MYVLILLTRTEHSLLLLTIVYNANADAITLAYNRYYNSL